VSTEIRATARERLSVGAITGNPTDSEDEDSGDEMISSAPPSQRKPAGSHRVMRTETGTKKLHPHLTNQSQRKKRLLQSHVGDPTGSQNKVYQAVPSERRHLHHDALDTDFTTAPGVI